MKRQLPPAKLPRPWAYPHHTVDFRDVFSKEVISQFCLQYSLGRTPNPCVNCNRMIKFGALLAKAGELGAAAMATGHYARIEKQSTGCLVLKKGVDRTRDQSYFLYKLTQPQLAAAVFPLGNMTKDSVRKIAAEIGLPSVKRKESREICFIPDNDYPRFLREHLSSRSRQAASSTNRAKCWVNITALSITLSGRERAWAFPPQSRSMSSVLTRKPIR